ncbi:MAG: hypothetical protein LBU88_01610 [Treponema sp.]|jgi:hypothetical protein|nr:hypothetical protein [Treponema sp.]
MEITIEFSPSAFDHNITESSIREAIKNPVYNDILDEFVNKYLLLGFDNSGKLLEIIYNDIDERSINVFHAMRCRKCYYHLLPGN